MINIVPGYCNKLSQKIMSVAWVEVSPLVMITRLQDPLQVFLLIGRS